MEIRRFYVNEQDINGNLVTITGDEFWHLTKVLRHKVGYKIIVCNNVDGNDYYCNITEIGADYCLAEVQNVVANECKTSSSVTLLQALPKGDKADLIVQKAVELGVQNIVFFDSSCVSESKFNAERLNKINVEACKQCGRSRISNIYGLISFGEMLSCLEKFDKVIMCYEKENERSIKQGLQAISGDKIAVIIGSEGGFAEGEATAIQSHGGVSVSLGKRIMRAETASIVACGLIMYELGEMGL